ncbi:zinc-ribbon domain-containing protein [Novosphingobium sp. BL-8A]|uniref:zinc-ribbon domain-containing protein n=1 Tax=Novosphingobium sp. BL-8A TaxID=3127639 RepID=UPI003757123F
MIIACPACSTRYAVPDSAIGIDGRTVRCAKCRHSWFQDGPEMVDAAAMPPASATPAPAPQAAPAPQPTPPEPVAQAPAPAPRAVERPQPAPAPAPVASEAPAPGFTVPPRAPAVRVPAPAPAPEVERDPLPASPPPAPGTRNGGGSYYDDTTMPHYADEGPSSFDFAPPFRPRRNWAKLATIASVVFAGATLALTGAVALGGLPDWLPIPRQTFSQAQPDLQLDFPRKRQDRKPLPDGSEFFSVSGTISNTGSETRYVPSLLVVLRDKRDRIVYEKEVVPSKRKLKPGEAITVNEALTDIPKAASAAEIGWKPD